MGAEWASSRRLGMPQKGGRVFGLGEEEALTDTEEEEEEEEEGRGNGRGP